ncbi:MAG TPA: methylated-DNA--[protein]-cysteine S-methyltransferase [Gallionellaceae bacterium]|nr:methylated-DNA--[protein]-cysteine S-methyltransferase [Gallionellaceae bacterium]
MKSLNEYQAVLTAPFGKLGIRCEGELLTGIDWLPPGHAELVPLTPFAQKVCAQLNEYFRDPDFRFTLPLRLAGTDRQQRVWRAMCAIPRGQTRQYGELARELASSPRAVGQACGANPIPIVVPCHRVVSKTGLGGFANHEDGYLLDIKRWLLAHEQR